jgi:hypothetical protein
LLLPPLQQRPEREKGADDEDRGREVDGAEVPGGIEVVRVVRGEGDREAHTGTAIAVTNAHTCPLRTPNQASAATATPAAAMKPDTAMWRWLM